MIEKINFANMLKIIWKSSKLMVWPNLLKIFNIFAKLIFASKIYFWVYQHPNNMHKNFHKILWHDKKWQLLQNQQKYIPQPKNVVAGKNLPYVSFSLDKDQIYNFSQIEINQHFSEGQEYWTFSTLRHFFGRFPSLWE